MDCNQVKDELVFLFVDNEMGSELLVAFRQHVDDCPPCARETRHARLFLTVLRERAGRCAAPRRLRNRILARLPHRQQLH